MEVNSVRLYHDQVLYKEAGGGITPWHCDQQYWPLTSDKTITAWIPLQATPLEMGPLEFSPGSQQLLKGRNLEIGDESEKELDNILRLTDFKKHRTAFDLGEVSFHSGWVFHRAGANTTNKTRKVMTVIYMDGEMKLKFPDNENQTRDMEKWCPGTSIGEIIDSPLNPILFP
jgi:ectoine hydroxylase-related dioxygenase (phytanoyl-CoA dioxygenase family)